MNYNFAMATVVGAVLLMILGFLLYGIAFAGFFESNMGSATGVVRDPPLWLWLIVGQIAGAAFLALIIGWRGATTAAAGAKTGAVMGALLSLYWGMVMYATTHISNLTAALVDPIVSAIMFGVTGAVIGLILARGARPI